MKWYGAQDDKDYAVVIHGQGFAVLEMIFGGHLFGFSICHRLRRNVWLNVPGCYALQCRKIFG